MEAKINLSEYIAKKYPLKAICIFSIKYDKRGRRVTLPSKLYMPITYGLRLDNDAEKIIKLAGKFIFKVTGYKHKTFNVMKFDP